MKYCAQCGAEYLDSITTCIDCNKPLVDELQWKDIVARQQLEDQEVFVKVKTVDDQFEADIIRDALEKEGIPVLVRSFRDTSFNGIFIPQKGWGVICVPDEFREGAKALIKDLHPSEDAQ